MNEFYKDAARLMDRPVTVKELLILAFVLWLAAVSTDVRYGRLKRRIETLERRAGHTDLI